MRRPSWRGALLALLRNPLHSSFFASSARRTSVSTCRTRTRLALVAALRAEGASRGLAARDVLHPLRIALTGASHGLPLPVVVTVLPRGEALERCRR